MMAVSSAYNDDGLGGNIGSSGYGGGVDAGKYVRYTPEQVEVLEKVYHECPKPSSLRRQQLIRESPLLSKIESKQIKVWFQNRRCRDKQRKESSRLQAVNRKLTAMNKLLMEENDRLQKQAAHLVYENGSFRQQTQSATGLTTRDKSCDSVVTSGQPDSTSQHPLRDASPAGLVSIADETLTEFLSKATGTAIEWIQMPGMKPGPDSIGIIAISHGCTGVAARACGLVSLEPARVAEILKDRPSWCHDCRSSTVNVLSTGNGGTIELLYMQLYALTTLASAHDLWLMRYTSILEDGGIVVCERSLNNTQNGPTMPPAHNFVRADMLPSGYLIRPCEGGGASIIHIVDHMNLEPWSVPEVLRPLYESSTLLAQRRTLAALRQLRQISMDISQPNVTGCGGRRPAALRALGHRITKGFNEAVNGFVDEGWSTTESDGVDDITILVKSFSTAKMMGAHSLCYDNDFSSSMVGGGVLCARASMLLQNVSPAILLRFLREHRSEWADSSIDSYVASGVKPGFQTGGGVGSQIILPLAHTIENEEFIEVVRLENNNACREDMYSEGDTFLLQLCNGIDEKAVSACAELVFAPIDASFSDDAPLLPSGFRIIPIDSSSKNSASPKHRLLDLASTLEGPQSGRSSNNGFNNSVSEKSVMTIAFQFAFDQPHLQEAVASMARQYVRSIISSVQRVASALSPSRSGGSLLGSSSLMAPEAETLARWIYGSYRCSTGAELVGSPISEGGEPDEFKTLWNHSDAVLCCSPKGMPLFTFGNQAGLDMLETTMVALLDIPLEKIFDENGRKAMFSQLPLIMQQGFVWLESGMCMSSMGRGVSYERAVAWKVTNDADDPHCICFMFVNWSFV